MASKGSISTFGSRTMPLLAILRHDLRTLRESWLVRIWLAATALLALLLAMSNWARFPTAWLIASLLVPYLVFPWFLVVMVLGVNPVSGSRLEPLADGFLSRPITRYEYLLAIWAARVGTVLGVYLLVMVPMVLLVTLANRPAAPADHVTLYGIVAALAAVGLVLTFQVSLAFLLGTLLRRPLLAIVLLVFFWSSVNTVFHTFKLQSFSPLSLSQALPTLLRQPWRSDANAEGLTSELDVEELQRQVANLSNFFSGAPPQKTETRPAFFETSEYKDFSLLRVLLGYGIPTLAAVGLSVFCFCWRDL